MRSTRTFVLAGAAAVIAAAIALFVSMRGAAEPATPATAPTPAPAAAQPATAPTTTPPTLASESPAPVVTADGSADVDRPAWDGQDLPPPPAPPAGGVERAPRPDKQPLSPDEQRAMQARGVALIDLRISSLAKEIAAADAANDAARAAKLRVRLARLEDTRRLREAALARN